MHVIIGRGNLGCDLYQELKRKGHKAKLLTAGGGFEWPESRPYLESFNPTHVWITAGFGSVGECKIDFSGALRTHVGMPTEMLEWLDPSVHIAAFSTDYAANEDYPDEPGCSVEKPLSLYAMSKRMMEQAFEFKNRPLSTVIRVGSLYGSEFAYKTFPGKVRLNHPEPGLVRLPVNVVTPTPTKWLAEVLTNRMDEIFSAGATTRHHLAPHGGVSLLCWGEMILGSGYQFESKGLDENRPARSRLGFSLPGNFQFDWEDLWAKYSI